MRTSIRLWCLLTAVVAFVVSAPTTAQAQNATFAGKVTSEDGQVLLGANVTIDALSISVGTNAQGQYTFTVAGARVAGQSAILRVRAIGYTPQTRTVTISDRAQTFDFALKLDVNRLNQVVVTGVTSGTEQRKLPFTVAQVTEQDMPVPGSNVLNNIQGKVPGAQIVNFSGRPGDAPAIMLRAPQSMDASAAGRSQQPLLIVDGVIQQGSLRDIDPTDIENVEIVKGAAASTLYGSRAAQGVIQITTKTGKNQSEGIRFHARVETGVSDIESTYRYSNSNFLIMSPDFTRFCVARGSAYVAAAEAQDCLQTVDLYTEQLRVNETSGAIIGPPVNFLGDGGIALAPPAINLRGWFQVNHFPVSGDPVQQAITNGQYTNTNIDVTGKFGGANFFASFGDNRQRGSVVFLDGFHRNNIRLNVDNTLGGNWTMSARAYYARSMQATGDNSGSGAVSGFFSLTRQPSYVDILRRDKFGRLIVRSVITNEGGQNSNPAYGWEQANGVVEGDRFLGSTSIRWQPLTWVDGTFDFGYDRSDSLARTQTPRDYRRTSTQGLTSLGNNSRSTGYSQSYNVSVNWTARRDLLRDLQARLTLRSSFEEQDTNGDSQSGANLAVPGITNQQNDISNQAIQSSEGSQRAIGMIASANLEWKERYILEASVRRDGLSVFGAANRWQTYGRGSLAWRLSEEKFYPFAKAVNDLKLRYSVGQAGNRPGNATQYETFTITSGGALTPATLGNRNLRPEVATEVEVGFDAEILHKYGLTVTHARDITKNQVLLVTPPAATGFSNQWRNAGTLEGNTWEASLNVPFIERRDLSWSARLNADKIKSKITSLDIPPAFYSGCGAGCHYGLGDTFGEEWGNRMVQTCNQLPAAFVSRCGSGKEWQKNDEGLIVWVGPGGNPNEGITNNKYQAVLPAQLSPWGVQSYWGMGIYIRDDSAAAAVKPLKQLPVGHALPDLRWSLGNTLTWKKFSAYVLLDAVKGKDVYNNDRRYSYGDFTTSENDQTGKTVLTAKPLGYYWRVGAPDATGIGGFYNNAMIATEDASFVKVRELSIGYRFGKIASVGDWTVSFVGRNLKTWTSYRGFDPEVGTAGGNNNSAVLNAGDNMGFPNLRQFTFTLSSSF